MKSALALGALLTGAALCVPAQAVSLAATNPLPAVRADDTATAAPRPIENWVIENWTNDSWSAGSAALVPLMAADTPAKSAASIDGPADGGADVTRKPPDDISFVHQATENGRKEVNAAREALPQLKNPELKRIAEMLASDHSAANARLSKLAETKGWPLPAPRSEASPPTGTASGDFDAKWTAEMIAGHERSLALYRSEAQNGADKDLRNFARDTLPVIEHHLAELRSVQK